MVLFGAYLFLRGDEIVDLGFFSLINERKIHNNNSTIAELLVQTKRKQNSCLLPP